MARISSQTYLNLLESGKHSDLTIDCQGVQFKVHRVLVCPQSPMIDAAMSRIKFPEEDPDILARVILFMYTNDYDDKSLPKFYSHLYLDDESLGLRKCLNVNALVYKTAEMLGLSDLQTVASARFMRDAQVAFDMDGFEQPAELLYENTRMDDRDLRFKVTQLCIENHDLLEIRPKTLAVLQHHEPNVWHVTVELMRRWASDLSPGNTLTKGFRRRLEKAVKDCNDKIAEKFRLCEHHGWQKTSKLKLENDGSLTFTCPDC
ncbi:hypothetical protein H2200_008909 [Cladophialophora chaetospira]|uniref:BTB domain-containing protein n=1 Tax=Cladophialophora chaetospira TaxID=386627 RepID=A0AA38X4X2_9EURO|nr:hypothetical protein H2200_008909 [Cladophialophora chaetospira]